MIASLAEPVFDSLLLTAREWKRQALLILRQQDRVLESTVNTLDSFIPDFAF